MGANLANMQALNNDAKQLEDQVSNASDQVKKLSSTLQAKVEVGSLGG